MTVWKSILRKDKMTAVFFLCGVFMLAALKGASARSVETGDYSCNDMGQDVLKMLNSFFETQMFFGGGVGSYRNPEELRQQVKVQIQMNAGVDIDNAESVETFICKLMGVTSLEDLSAMIHIPVVYLRQGYTMAMSQFRMLGMDKIDTQWQMYKRFLIAAHDAGYPKWPLNITTQQTRAFISGMVDDFGNEFVRLFTFMETNRDTVDIERFVDAVTEATTDDEFAEISGLSSKTIHAIRDSLRLLESPTYDQDTFLGAGDAALRIIWGMDRHHLFDLQ